MNTIKTHKVKIILISCIIVFCSTAAYFSTPKKPQYYNLPKIDQEKLYKVEKVLDGDTFEINVENRLVTVRMLGIDTPETVDPRKPVQCFGKEASNKTKELLEGHFVALKRDKTQPITDKYGRFLAYVYREDNLLINEYLLKEGYAHEYTYGKAYQMKKEFKKLEKDANKNKRGLWGDKCKGITI